MLRVLVVVVFVAAVAAVCVCFLVVFMGLCVFVGGVDGCLCGVPGVGVHGILDGVLGAPVVLLGISRDAQQNHCRTHHAIKKRMYVFKNTCRATQSHSKPLKATVAPLKATESHITFSKCHC